MFKSFKASCWEKIKIHCPHLSKLVDNIFNFPCFLEISFFFVGHPKQSPSPSRKVDVIYEQPLIWNTKRRSILDDYGYEENWVRASYGVVSYN